MPATLHESELRRGQTFQQVKQPVVCLSKPGGKICPLFNKKRLNAFKTSQNLQHKKHFTSGLYISINIPLYHNMLENYITNCIPYPHLHSILLPVATVLLGTFWLKLLFKLQISTEKAKFSVAICVDMFSNCDGKNPKLPQNRNQLYLSMYSNMYYFPLPWARNICIEKFLRCQGNQKWINK